MQFCLLSKLGLGGRVRVRVGVRDDVMLGLGLRPG